MTPPQPPISDDQAQAFAFAVGKAIQNFGTIEYLINEVISILVNDALLTSNLVQLGVAKRLDLLASLVERRQDPLSKQGWVAGDLFSCAKAVFRERNKIAHNPCVVREAKSDGRVVVTVGIHVLRYLEDGTKEEWIDQGRLESMTLASRDTLVRFNHLLGCCKAVGP